nr:MAG TPA: hypothetical protein [Caudoviricetes sp.]
MLILIHRKDLIQNLLLMDIIRADLVVAFRTYI